VGRLSLPSRSEFLPISFIFFDLLVEGIVSLANVSRYTCQDDVTDFV
jgi:hypothetical protein